jgi:hypothetical protein
MNGRRQSSAFLKHLGQWEAVDGTPGIQGGDGTHSLGLERFQLTPLLGWPKALNEPEELSRSLEAMSQQQ